MGLKKKKKRKSSSWDYFDDCLVCQSMKYADERGRELSPAELMEAMRKANAAQKNNQGKK